MLAMNEITLLIKGVKLSLNTRWQHHFEKLQHFSATSFVIMHCDSDDAAAFTSLSPSVPSGNASTVMVMY